MAPHIHDHIRYAAGIPRQTGHISDSPVDMGVLGDYVLRSSNGSDHAAAINYVRSLGPCPQLGETNTNNNHETAGLGPASMALS